MTAVTPGEIEVGAVADADLRYWLAKEAVRQGETRLNAQNSVRTALEARATAITGWGAVGLLATAGASFTARDQPTFSGAAIAAVALFTAAALGIFAARPRNWSLTGYEPARVAAMLPMVGTELEVLEALGGGLEEGIRINNQRIERMAVALRWAGWLLICAPLGGVVAYRASIAWGAVVVRASGG